MFNLPLKRRKNFKDMNVSNLGVQEMNAEEIRNTDGGSFLVMVALFVAAAIGINEIAESITNNPPPQQTGGASSGLEIAPTEHIL